jgi:trehalose 6-phosphate synthase
LPGRTAAAGGLAVGVLGALAQHGGIWFGWSGELCDEEPCGPKMQVRDSVTYATIDLRRDHFERFYNGFSNDALWPLFHYMPDKFRFRAADWHAYQAVNAQFATALAPLLHPNDLVWVHDYHLVPLARELRERQVHQPLGFFLHIPFPYFEVLRVLPTHRELLSDLLKYDVVGFQTESDLLSFHSCVARVFGANCILDDRTLRHGNRIVATDVFPIGVDVERLNAQAMRARRSETVERMMGSLLGRRLMIGVDRLDYSKGLVERFGAYEQFLETHPEYRGRLTYLQIAPLSRKHMQSYVEIRRALEQAAGKTNGRFGDADWTPIRYINRNVVRETLMGFMRAADVALVTPLRDGMNLVAKEYLAAQDADDPGVLVLSEFAGAAQELNAALQVNPHDVSAVGSAVKRALSMSLMERKERHSELLAVLRRNDIAAWTGRFIDSLAAVRSKSADCSERSEPHVTCHERR